MLVRVLTALVGIPLAVVLTFYPGGLPFAVGIGIVSVIGAAEFYGGVRRTGVRPIEWAGLAAVALFVVCARTYNYTDRTTIGAVFPTVLTLLLILSFVVELARSERAPIANVGSTVFGAIYVGWLISHIVALRQIPDTISLFSHSIEKGAVLVMFVFLCTWACDTSAYFIGRFYGRIKLAPKLSPNKTVEGAAAGFIGSLLLAVVLGAVINLPVRHSLAIGVMLGILSQLGDFSESAIKRELGIKDFGRVFPGHGGMLDRFDSLLFTAPAIYYYAVLFLAH